MSQSKDHLGGNEEVPNPDKLIGKAAKIRAEQIAKEQAPLLKLIKEHDNEALAQQIVNTMEAEGAEVRADPNSNKAVIIFGKKLGNGAIQSILLDAPRQAVLQKTTPSTEKNSIKGNRSTSYKGVVVDLTYSTGHNKLTEAQRSKWVDNGDGQALVSLPDRIDLANKDRDVASLCDDLAMYSEIVEPNDIVKDDGLDGL